MQSFLLSLFLHAAFCFLILRATAGQISGGAVFNASQTSGTEISVFSAPGSAPVVRRFTKSVAQALIATPLASAATQPSTSDASGSSLLLPLPAGVGGNDKFSFSKEGLKKLQQQNPFPRYPESARQLRQEGQVVLDVVLQVEGTSVSQRAKSVSLAKSSGFQVLDEQAKTTVTSEWDFSQLAYDEIFQRWIERKTKSEGLLSGVEKSAPPLELKLRLPFRFLLREL